MPSALQDKGKNGQGRRFGWVALLVAMIVGGLLTYGGSEVVAWTNTEKFCISCHEMRENVYAEFE
ncbi:MAG: NapC/NirT family cytochrome c, partial [Gammaproteobacteria bacterium]|nr:NapC/NirT family cytochrome c [Gammaproteobacteria bacterium]